MIVIDTREPPELVKLVEEAGREVERTTLSAGDFLVDDLIIERKEYGDYLGRLKTSENDMFMQAQRLVLAAEEQDLRPMLLLEGSWAEALHWSEMNLSYIMSSLAGLSKMGIDMFHTPDLKGTALYVAHREKDDTKGDPRKIRNTPTVPPEMMPVYLVQGFEGIGAKTGEKILSHEKFTCFKDVVNASVEDLMEVPGVGKTTAEKIVDHVNMKL